MRLVCGRNLNTIWPITCTALEDVHDCVKVPTNDPFFDDMTGRVVDPAGATSLLTSVWLNNGSISHIHEGNQIRTQPGLKVIEGLQVWESQPIAVRMNRHDSLMADFAKEPTAPGDSEEPQ